MPRRHPRPDPRRGRGAGAGGARPDPTRAAESEARRRAACAAKVRYDSAEQARAFALMHQPGRGPRATAYLCEICDGWHHTRGGTTKSP